MVNDNIVSDTAPIFEIPRDEWPLDLNQLRLIESIEKEMPQVTIQRFKADSIPFWHLTLGEIVLGDLALSAAIRRLREAVANGY